MSSIAYVTDAEMFEYHRIHGNDKMNFWRPRSKQQFTDFHPGDLLFFYSKAYGYQEKGILGYGRFVKQEVLTFEKMWEKYGSLNGYDNKELLEEAILSFSKCEKMPEKISSLVLVDIVYFNVPLFASDLNLDVKENLESYLYLDHKDVINTPKILKWAMKIGQDPWTIQNRVPHCIEDDLMIYYLQQSNKKTIRYQKTQEKQRLKKLYMKSLEQGYQGFSSDTLYKLEKDRFIVRFLFAPSNIDFEKRFESLAGKMLLTAVSMRRANGKEIVFEIESTRKNEMIQKVSEVINDGYEKL